MHNEARPCSHKMCVRITMEEEKEKNSGYIYIHDGKEQEEKNEKFHSP